MRSLVVAIFAFLTLGLQVSSRPVSQISAGNNVESRALEDVLGDDLVFRGIHLVERYNEELEKLQRRNLFIEQFVKRYSDLGRRSPSDQPTGGPSSASDSHTPTGSTEGSHSTAPSGEPLIKGGKGTSEYPKGNPKGGIMSRFGKGASALVGKLKPTWKENETPKKGDDKYKNIKKA